jgi:uncharacterized membrane protein (GlpM family)
VHAKALIEALAKGGVAGIIVAVILLLKSYQQFAGILVMLPVISATSFLFVGLSDGPQAAQRLALSALIALPTAVVFIASMYVLLGRLGVIVSLVSSYVLWAVAAAVTLWISR